MKHVPILLAGAVTATLLPGAATAATFIIDDFTTFQEVAAVPRSGDVANSEVSAAGGSTILGGARDLAVTNDNGTPDGTGALADDFFGLLEISNRAATSGDTFITYDGLDGDATAGGVNTTGLGGIDLTLGRSISDLSFAFGINFVDFKFDYSITVWSGSSGSVVSSTVAGRTPGTEQDSTGFVPIDGPIEVSFLDFAGIDFTDVGAIQFQFSSLQGGDIAIDFLGIAAVPVPAGLPLLIGGLGAFGALRRRQNKQG